MVDVTIARKNFILEMGKNNPGSIRVMCDLLNFSFKYILMLDDLNIRSHEIWEYYKDKCDEDINVFKKLIEDLHDIHLKSKKE